MAEDPLHDIIDSVRTRLQAELETQLRSVSERHQQALAAERERAEVELEQRWAGRFDAARAESEAHVDAAIAAVRAEMEQQAAEDLARIRDESERRLAADTERLRAEADQRAAEAASEVRRELEQALAAERQLAQSRLDEERRSAAEQMEQAREAFDAERSEWAGRAEAAAPAAEPAPLAAGSLLERFRSIETATTVSDSLAAIARAAAAEAPRAALFIANGAQLDEWAVAGLSSLAGGALRIDDPDSGPVVEALTSRKTVRHNGTACAVPLVLDGAPIGVLYGEAEGGSTTTNWSDSLEAIAHFGAAHLGYLTALRTAQARAWLADGSAAPQAGAAQTAPASEDDAASARRYARLLVSEIKLYNEAAVQAGRSRRDLRERLQPEIERARRLYEERVPASILDRMQYFQQELVQTLAGGDPSLLG